MFTDDTNDRIVQLIAHLVTLLFRSNRVWTCVNIWTYSLNTENYYKVFFVCFCLLHLNIHSISNIFVSFCESDTLNSENIVLWLCILFIRCNAFHTMFQLWKRFDRENKKKTKRMFFYFVYLWMWMFSLWALIYRKDAICLCW